MAPTSVQDTNADDRVQNFAVNFTDKSVQTELAQPFRLRNRVSARSILLHSEEYLRHFG
jgi:hypothetical protein